MQPVAGLPWLPAYNKDCFPHDLRRLLLSHSGGIPLAALQGTWAAAYNAPFPPLSALGGYGSVWELLQSVPHVACVGPPPEFRVTVAMGPQWWSGPPAPFPPGPQYLVPPPRMHVPGPGPVPAPAPPVPPPQPPVGAPPPLSRLGVQPTHTGSVIAVALGLPGPDARCPGPLPVGAGSLAPPPPRPPAPPPAPDPQPTARPVIPPPAPAATPAPQPSAPQQRTQQPSAQPLASLQQQAPPWRQPPKSVDPRFGFDLRTLLLRHPDGLPLDALPREWQALYGVPLPGCLLGFPTLRDLIVAIPAAAILGPAPEHRLKATPSPFCPAGAPAVPVPQIPVIAGGAAGSATGEGHGGGSGGGKDGADGNGTAPARVADREGRSSGTGEQLCAAAGGLQSPVKAAPTPGPSPAPPAHHLLSPPSPSPLPPSQVLSSPPPTARAGDHSSPGAASRPGIGWPSGASAAMPAAMATATTEPTAAPTAAATTQPPPSPAAAPPSSPIASPDAAHVPAAAAPSAASPSAADSDGSGRGPLAAPSDTAVWRVWVAGPDGFQEVGKQLRAQPEAQQQTAAEAELAPSGSAGQPLPMEAPLSSPGAQASLPEDMELDGQPGSEAAAAGCGCGTPGASFLSCEGEEQVEDRVPADAVQADAAANGALGADPARPQTRPQSPPTWTLGAMPYPPDSVQPQPPPHLLHPALGPAPPHGEPESPAGAAPVTPPNPEQATLREPPVDPRFARDLRRMLFSHPSSSSSGETAGVPLQSLPDAWAAFYPVPFPRTLLGYASLLDLISAVPHAARIEPGSEQHLITGVLTPAGAEELFQHVRREVEGGASWAHHPGCGRRLSPKAPQPPPYCVSYEAVVAGLNFYLGCRSFESLGLEPPTGLVALQRLDRRVTAAMEAYCAARAVVTLWELERHVCGQEAVPAYEALGLGPLTAHPLVRRVFFAPAAPQAAGPSNSAGAAGPAGSAADSAPPGPPPDFRFPPLTAFDVASALRRVASRRGLAWCRAACASRSPSGRRGPASETLLWAVLEELAALAAGRHPGLWAAGHDWWAGPLQPPSGHSQQGSGPQGLHDLGTGPACQGGHQGPGLGLKFGLSGAQGPWPVERGPQPDRTHAAMMRLGLVINDLSLYVETAIVAMREEQWALLRGVEEPPGAPGCRWRHRGEPKEVQQQQGPLEVAAVPADWAGPSQPPACTKTEKQKRKAAEAAAAAAAATTGSAAPPQQHQGDLQGRQAQQRKQQQEQEQQRQRAPIMVGVEPARRKAAWKAAAKQTAERLVPPLGESTYGFWTPLLVDYGLHAPKAPAERGDEVPCFAADDRTFAVPAIDALAAVHIEQGREVLQEQQLQLLQQKPQQQQHAGCAASAAAPPSCCLPLQIGRNAAGAAAAGAAASGPAAAGAASGAALGPRPSGVSAAGMSAAAKDGRWNTENRLRAFGTPLLPHEPTFQALCYDPCLRLAFARKLGIPVDFTHGDLQAAFDARVRELMGGCLVEAAPPDSFYSQAAAALARDFIGPAIQGHAAMKLASVEQAMEDLHPQAPKTGRTVLRKRMLESQPEAVAGRVREAADRCGAHVLMQLLLRALHAAMRGQLAVQEAQMARVRGLRPVLAMALAKEEEEEGKRTVDVAVQTGDAEPAEGAATAVPQGAAELCNGGVPSDEQQAPSDEQQVQGGAAAGGAAAGEAEGQRDSDGAVAVTLRVAVAGGGGGGGDDDGGDSDDDSVYESALETQGGDEGPESSVSSGAFCSAMQGEGQERDLKDEGQEGGVPVEEDGEEACSGDSARCGAGADGGDVGAQAADGAAADCPHACMETAAPQQLLLAPALPQQVPERLSDRNGSLDAAVLPHAEDSRQDPQLLSPLLGRQSGPEAQQEANQAHSTQAQHLAGRDCDGDVRMDAEDAGAPVAVPASAAAAGSGWATTDMADCCGPSAAAAAAASPCRQHEGVGAKRSHDGSLQGEGRREEHGGSAAASAGSDPRSCPPSPKRRKREEAAGPSHGGADGDGSGGGCRKQLLPALEALRPGHSAHRAGNGVGGSRERRPAPEALEASRPRRSSDAGGGVSGGVDNSGPGLASKPLESRRSRRVSDTAAGDASGARRAAGGHATRAVEGSNGPRSAGPGAVQPGRIADPPAAAGGSGGGGGGGGHVAAGGSGAGGSGGGGSGSERQRPLVLRPTCRLGHLRQVVFPTSRMPTVTTEMMVTGRWGEELVFHNLLVELAGGGARAVWVNQDGESFLPYDIVVYRDEAVVSYIEVKASASHTKALFEVSTTQLAFAEQHGPRYEFYFVRGARGPAPEVVRLANPARLLRTRVVQLYMNTGVQEAST